MRALLHMAAEAGAAAHWIPIFIAAAAPHSCCASASPCLPSTVRKAPAQVDVRYKVFHDLLQLFSGAVAQVTASASTLPRRTGRLPCCSHELQHGSFICVRPDSVTGRSVPS